MASPPSKRLAIYARVSTLDKGQDPETQLLQLREYVDRRGFDLAGEYVDYFRPGSASTRIAFLPMTTRRAEHTNSD